MSSLDQLYNHMFSKDTKKLQNGLKRVRPTRRQMHELLATALTLNGRQEVAKVLLNHGAPINWNVTRNNTYPLSHTPLFMAILKRKDDLVRLLLDHGSNPNQRDASGFSPLHRAAAIPNNEKIIRLLLKKGANVDAKTPRKNNAFTPFERGENTPLHIAVHQGGEEINSQEVFKNVRVLVDLGKAKLNVKNSEGETPLHIAAKQDANMVHQIQFLIDRGAYINVKNQDGETPLHIAARLLKMHNVKILLKNGAIPFIQSNFGQTPADIAKNLDYFYTPTNVERKIRAWPGERSVRRRVATASLNSVRNKKSGQKLHIPNNIKQRILSQTGLFRRNQFGRPINTNNTEIRNAWTKEKQRRDRKRKRNNT